MTRRLRAQPARRKNNPWEILVVAAFFFFPGLALLFQREPIVAFQQSYRWVRSGTTALMPRGAHIFGVLAIGVALVVVYFYFRLRRDIRRDEDAGIRYPDA